MAGMVPSLLRASFCVSASNVSGGRQMAQLKLAATGASTFLGGPDFDWEDLGREARRRQRPPHSKGSRRIAA